MYTLDYAFSYCSKKFIHACTESSTHAHGTKSEAEILNILKQPWDSQCNRCFATVSQGFPFEPQTVLEGQGHFAQHL